jgi:capsular exopolysaccharide synthesis family protein
MSLITLTNPRSPVSEAYRTLRTNLSFYNLDSPLRTLVVGGPTSKEESALTAANLAVTMAQGGLRTILVDADLRRPTLHTFFAKEPTPGLTHSLRQEGGKLPLQETGVENLWLLTAGEQPPNPTDLLGSRRMDELLAQLHAEAEMLIFSVPPITAVSDATVIGSKVDGFLLVVRAGQTKRDQAQRAQEILQTANVRLVGVTLTNAPKDSSLSEYY